MKDLSQHACQTAEMFLIFCLGRPDILPVGDLGLRKAIQKAYSLFELPSLAAIRNIARAWKPYCSVATGICGSR